VLTARRRQLSTVNTLEDLVTELNLLVTVSQYNWLILLVTV
jgi:hypothetical protein